MNDAAEYLASINWLELSQEAGLGPAAEHQWFLQEANELLALFTRIGRTSKARK